MGLVKDMGIKNPAYREVLDIETQEELISEWDHLYANVFVAMGRMFSPNPENPPFYADLPYVPEGDRMVVNNEVLGLWQNNLPLEMINDYADNLRQLKALKLDWGRNDEFAHIPYTIKMFSIKLENLGINHYAEEHIGTHSNKLWTDDGRGLNDMMPFFDA